MRGPGAYSHLHYACNHTHPLCTYPHIHTHVQWAHSDTQFWCSYSPQGAEQDRRFMFSVVHTLFSRLAPCSLGLLHGHTCYSNKPNGASLRALMDSRQWREFPQCKNPKETSQRMKPHRGNLSPSRQEEDCEVVQPSIIVSCCYKASV